jgi:hypothetical protein
MLEQNNISVFYQKVFAATILFCVVCAFESVAQNHEGDRNMPEVRVGENYGVMESPESGNTYHSSPAKSSVDTKSSDKDKLPSNSGRSSSLYRQGGEKDVKRDNVSTLSFNLFLYIVDKFKEED